MWWASHRQAGVVQSPARQPWSRVVRARRWSGVTSRRRRPTSRITDPPRVTIRPMWLSQSSRSRSDRGIWVPSSEFADPGVPVLRVSRSTWMSTWGVWRIPVSWSWWARKNSAIATNASACLTDSGRVGVPSGSSVVARRRACSRVAPATGCSSPLRIRVPEARALTWSPWRGSGGSVSMQCVGVALPAGHHPLDVADGEFEQGGDQFRFMLGEQRQRVGREVGDDGVDLPTGQLAAWRRRRPSPAAGAGSGRHVRGGRRRGGTAR